MADQNLSDLRESIRALVADIVEKDAAGATVSGAGPGPGTSSGAGSAPGDPAGGMPVAQGTGIHPTIDIAVTAAKQAFTALGTQGLKERRAYIAAMKEAALRNGALLARMAAEETGMGNPTDKHAKNMVAAEETPGVEDLQSEAFTNEHGLALVERAPYGVIGAITPSTNPTATIISNSIGMIAAGNAVVFNPHPAAKACSAKTVTILNDAIVAAGGPPNLLTTIASPTIESANRLMDHPSVAIMVVTGGPGVVKAAMQRTKKVIAAGPGNPPCVVDETAHIDKAGRDIVNGGGFDHNIVCICEKEVLVVESVADALIESMGRHGAFFMSAEQTALVTNMVIKEPGAPGKEGAANKQFVGKSPAFIAGAAGFSVPDGTKLLACVVPADHALVWTEQLMPVMPVVRLPNVDACIDLAVECEHGFRHTAIMHSLNVEKLSEMARRMNCSLFVKNGPCYAGLARGGAGFTSFTIASPTGEGLTRARTFTRERRCTLVDYFRIV
ncbi:MAG: aldehyde dehydrogenase family protein [Spirochaetaceae bacterium]